MTTESNPYLAGNFAPIEQEVELPCPEVEGTLPADLEGFFFRVGPNIQFEPMDRSAYHPFDGDGMIHSVDFREGRATYRNRWIRTAAFERERSEGRALWSGFMNIGAAAPPDDAPFKNTANTALAFQGNRLLALWEGGSPYEISLPSLDTVGECTFGGSWPHALSAHPKVDPRTGELMVFCYSAFEAPHVRYGVVDAGGKLRHETHVDLLGKPVMIHDLAITEHYSLILDFPVTFSLERLASGGQAFDWEPQNGARIGVLPRYAEGSEVRWLDVEPGYVFHVFNAWEESGGIMLEACVASRVAMLGDADRDDEDSDWARMHRYRLDLGSGKVEEGRVDETPLEMARVNESMTGTRTRYGYASRFYPTADPTRGLRFDGILKHDRTGDRMECIELGENRFVQENVFAPRPESRTEDDGYLVGFVHDETTERSECWVIDAQRFGDGPIARVHMPHRVPYGFHSHWVPGSANRLGQRR